MRRKRFGFTGLALLLAGAVGMASVAARSGDGMSPVSDADAIQVLGGGGCGYYSSVLTGCGESGCPGAYCSFNFNLTIGANYGAPVKYYCTSCGTTCGTYELLGTCSG
jgi:hypothetical protein